MLKIIFLNSWFLRARKPLYEFLREHAENTDVFCFSEVSNGESGVDMGQFVDNGKYGHLTDIVEKSRSDSFRELCGWLSGFVGKYEISEAFDLSGKKIPMGLAVFVKEKIMIKNYQSVVVNDSTDIPNCFERIMQVLEVEKDGNIYWVNNAHGLSVPGNKLDNPKRIQQSENICKKISEQTGKIILGGDFNLMPETESIKILEQSGLRNLIKEFQIKETRSELNFLKFKDSSFDIQHYADFAFVSKEVVVKNFSVPNVNISDHLPLILEVE